MHQGFKFRYESEYARKLSFALHTWRKVSNKVTRKFVLINNLIDKIFSLKYLSLRLCEISDNGMKKIAKELEYHDPPDNPKLTILNLAHNHITKNGAGHIGNMLRTNR